MSTLRAFSLSDDEIRLEGWKALTERMGVPGAIRFLSPYDPGHGAIPRACDRTPHAPVPEAPPRSL